MSFHALYTTARHDTEQLPWISEKICTELLLSFRRKRSMMPAARERCAAPVCPLLAAHSIGAHHSARTISAFVNERVLVKRSHAIEHQ